jgi:hypothetical protein
MQMQAHVRKEDGLDISVGAKRIAVSRCSDRGSRFHQIRVDYLRTLDNVVLQSRFLKG